MSTEFDREYWDRHWDRRDADARTLPAHPALETEIAALPPGAALDAGSGEGAEAMWLADRGWSVTAVDIAGAPLRRPGTPKGAGAGAVTWVEADLTRWEPAHTFDLVTTFYAHPTISQLAFYERIAGWVGPGGTLLIVGHHDDHHHDHGHPSAAVTDPEQIRAILPPGEWDVLTAEVRRREVAVSSGHARTLNDVVVRARRR